MLRMMCKCKIDGNGSVRPIQNRFVNRNANQPSCARGCNIVFNANEIRTHDRNPRFDPLADNLTSVRKLGTEIENTRGTVVESNRVRKNRHGLYPYS